MIKVIHSADMHLDTPMSVDAGRQRSELISDFKALISFTNRENADILLIAGDLFDTPFPEEKCVFDVLSILSDCNAEIFISPGNHDPYTSGSVYEKYEFPENVHIFTTPEVRCIHARCGADVYGYAFTSVSAKRRALPEVSDKSRLSIYSIHADISGTGTSYAPLTTADIEMTKAHYVALGHIHKRTEICRAGETPYAYCGSLCARDFGETGKKGVILAEFDPIPTGFSSRFEFIPLVKRHYEQRTLNLTDIADQESLLGELHSLILREGFGKYTSLRVILKGELERGVSIFDSAFSEISDKLFEFEYENKTVQALCFEELEGDRTVKGELYKVLKDKLASTDPYTKAQARLALKMALTALSGEDISDLTKTQEPQI